MNITTTDEELAKFVTVVLAGVLNEYANISLPSDLIITMKNALREDISKGYTATSEAYTELLNSKLGMS